MNKSPLVTIAIPFYNSEKFLELAVLSVLNQTYTNWELILINDGSTDDSIKIARTFTDSRISLFDDHQNKGLASRLNQSVDIAKGKYYARMDADDIMHKDRIRKQIEILEVYSEIDILGTNAFSINEHGYVVGVRLNPNQNRIFKVKTFIHPTIMGRTQWFRNNPYDISAVRLEDVDLWIRTCEKNNFQCLAEPLMYYREFGKDYYKKYFQGLSSLPIILRNNGYRFKFLKFSIKYIFASIRAYIYYILGKENNMIVKRNYLKL